MTDINAAKSMQSEPTSPKELTPDQASMLADIFLETDAFYKIEISLEPVSRDVTIIFHDMDELDFNDLLEFGRS